jgi:2-polyprenyl-3-methyl-5-hydroxy-6-metoxy-1,4-benzoquinol methylase
MLLTYQRKSFTNSNGQIVHIEELPWEIGHHDYNIEEVFEGLSGDILELGCGSGNDAIWFAKKGFNVTAIDISEQEINLAKEKSKGISNIQYIVDDVHQFSSEERFDIIYDRGFLHNTQPSLPKLFYKLYHLLKDSGKIIILTGNPNHKASKGTLPTPMYIQTIEKNSENLFNIKLVKEIEFEQNVGYENSLGWLFVLEKK